MKKTLIIAFLVFIVALGMSINLFAAQFELSTDKVFSPAEQAMFMVSSMGIPTLDVRVYKVDDPAPYFLGLTDIHAPSAETKRDVSSPTEMIGGVKRKAARLLRDDYRGALTEDIRKDFVAALGLPHAEEVKSPAPGSYELYPTLEAYPLVKRWQENLVMTGPTGWDYHDIQLGINAPGCYLVEAVYQDMVGYTMVVISSLSFVVKDSPTDNLVYVTDRVTGKPVKNAKVTIWNTDKSLIAKGRTNRNGVFYEKSNMSESEMVYIFAEKGDNFSLADPYTYFWWSESGDKVYTYTDRPVYRPGHTVFFRSILREAEDSDLVTPDTGEKYLVIITDAKGNEVYRNEHEINEFGSISGEFKLGSEPPLGDYQIIVSFKGENFYSSFKVEEYKKPEFEVKVNTEKEVYIQGDSIKANIDAKYYFGSPVANGKVEYVVYRQVYERPWWWGYEWAWYFLEDDYYGAYDRAMVADGNAKLDENGKFSITLDSGEYIDSPDKDYTFIVEAKVTDLSRREVSGSWGVKVVRASFSTIVQPDRWVYAPKDEANIVVTALDYENNGVAGVPITLIVTELSEKNNQVYFSETLTATTGPDGKALFTHVVRGVGKVNFSAHAFDAFGNSTTATDYVYSYDWAQDYGWEGGGGNISVIPDKSSYSVGDTAHILIVSPIKEGYILITTEERSIKDKEVLRVKNGSAVFDLPIKERHSPNIFVTASLIFNDELYTESKKVIVPAEHKFVKIEVTSNKDTYEPQEEGTFTIRTTDSDGKPVSTEVSLGIVDDSIYAIAPESVTEIEKYFYSIRPHLVETSSSLYFRFYGYSHRKGMLSALEDKETTLADFKGEQPLVEPKIRKDFKDTMYWSPAIVTGIDGVETITVTFPDNLTRWRATVRGITSGDKVGEAKYRVISRKDLLVRIEAPRFFRQGDELVISTIAHNYLSEPKKVKFTFEATGLELMGGAPAEFVIPKNSEKRIDWKVRATEVGNAVLLAKAMTDVESDGMELTIPVLPSGIREVKNDMGEIIKDSGDMTLSVTKPSDAIKNSSELVITATPTLSSTMLSAIPFLVGYPYG